MAPISFLSFSRSKLLKSPTPALLRTNDPPSEHDIVRIRAAIIQVDQQLTKKSPQQDCCSYTKFITIHKAILSPFRRLPTELVVEILLLCNENPVNPKRNIVPWKLAHINHRWRIIALNTPSLWRNLPPLRINSLERQPLKRQIGRLSTLLTLSGSSPLTFFLAKTVAPTPDDEIISMLFKHSERWEKISLAICEDVCAQFMKVKGQISSLRSLRLLLTTTGSLSLDMFEVAPKLREVSLGSLTWPGIVKLPWNQITNFTEDASRTDHIMTVFGSSTESLERLNFITDQSWALFDGTAVIRPTTLPKLTCLALQTPFETGLTSLLDALTVPALEELVLKLFTAQSLSRQVVDLIERSRCSLQKLTFYTSTVQHIEQILALTPCLTELDINDPPQNLICALTNINSSLGAQQWALLPFLETLTVRVCPNYTLLSKLKRLARIRCDLVIESTSGTETARCTPLREFNIACPMQTQGIDRDFDVWAAARFAQLCFETFAPCASPHERVGSESTATTETKKRIDGELCEISAVNKNSTMTRKTRLSKIAKHVQTLVNHLEAFAMTPENVIYLYLKRIDFTLNCLVESLIPLEQKPPFDKRVKALVAKWSLVLKAVSPTMHWGWQQDGFLTYLRSEHNGCSRDITRFAFQRYHCRVGLRSNPWSRQLPADLDFKQPCTTLWQLGA